MRHVRKKKAREAELAATRPERMARLRQHLQARPDAPPLQHTPPAPQQSRDASRDQWVNGVHPDAAAEWYRSVVPEQDAHKYRPARPDDRVFYTRPPPDLDNLPRPPWELSGEPAPDWYVPPPPPDVLGRQQPLPIGPPAHLRWSWMRQQQAQLLAQVQQGRLQQHEAQQHVPVAAEQELQQLLSAPFPQLHPEDGEQPQQEQPQEPHPTSPSHHHQQQQQQQLPVHPPQRHRRSEGSDAAGPSSAVGSPMHHAHSGELASPSAAGRSRLACVSSATDAPPMSSAQQQQQAEVAAAQAQHAELTAVNGQPPAGQDGIASVSNGGACPPPVDELMPRAAYDKLQNKLERAKERFLEMKEYDRK